MFEMWNTVSSKLEQVQQAQTQQQPHTSSGSIKGTHHSNYYTISHIPVLHILRIT